MKTVLIFLTVCFFTTSVWAQTQEERPIVVTEKWQGKVMRIEQHKRIDIISENSFINPRYTHDEAQFFWLSYDQTTYNKELIISLVGDFLRRYKKYFELEKISSLNISCYFAKNTFELKEITYVLPTGSISNYSILRKLTEEIKAKGNLSLSRDFKAIINRSRSDLNKFTSEYFKISIDINYSKLKPYLNKGSIKN